MRKKTILVVEDELMIAEDLLESLSDMGYSVPCTVSSGPEAIARVKEFRPDLVLMDIMLKGPWDGIETAHEIHRHHDCALIYLTAYTDQKMLQRAKITSPFGYILKPFREKELQAMVEISLHRHETERRERELKALFHQTLATTQDAILVTNPQGQIQLYNPSAARLFQLQEPLALTPISQLWKWSDSEGNVISDILTPTPKRRVQISLQTGESLFLWINVTALETDLTDNQHGFVINVFPQASDPPLSLSHEFTQELISLCASCKNVRTLESGYISLENYFRERFGIRFSHGICPCCFETLYPDYLPETPLELPEQSM